MDERTNALQRLSKKTTFNAGIAIYWGSLVVALLKLVFLDVLVEDREDGWAVVVELLSLALVENNDVLDLSVEVETLETDGKDEGRQNKDRNRHSDDDHVPLDVH